MLVDWLVGWLVGWLPAAICVFESMRVIACVCERAERFYLYADFSKTLKIVNRERHPMQL